MKLWWSLLLVGVALPMLIGASSDNEASDLWDEDDKEVLVRTIRGTKKERSSSNSPACRYEKGPWSECDPTSNMRSRSLTLKKGDRTCEPTKNITKKCKKEKRVACRYTKGSWSSCINHSMARVDNLKPGSDVTCEKTRRVSKDCNKEPKPKNKKNGEQKKGNKQQ